MSTAGPAVAGSTTVFGAGLAVLAVATYRRWAGPGRTSLAAFVGMLAVSAVGTGATAWTVGLETTTLWLTTCAQVGAIAWVAFALRYTGRAPLVSRRARWTATAAYVGFVALPFFLGVVVSNPDLLGFLAISGYMLGLVATLLGAALVLETTYRHGYLSGWVGLALAFVAIDPWFLTMVGFATQGQFAPTVLYGLYLGGFLAYVVVLAAVLLRTDAPTVTVATQTVGRRALLSETTDLVLVVDDDGRVVERNEALRTELPADAGDGRPASELLGTDIDDLREQESAELSTVDGRRQYDVQTVELTDRRSGSLGWLVSLRDITERQRREQVLDVLNRFLRHNLRNELDVTKARVNFVAADLEDPELSDHLSRALSSVDSVLALADKARTTQQTLEADRSDPVAVALPDRVRHIAGDVSQDLPGEVTVDGDDVTLRTEEDLFTLAVRNVVENALEHSTAETPRATVTVTDTGDGVRVRVDDNGPGIPAAETDVIESGRETDIDHTSSIGLWLVEWATTACGGTVSFGETPDGGRVDLWFPDR